MSDDEIKQARRWFAEELRFVARVEDPRVVKAFASVPRELFVGPGPLRMLSHWNLQDYWTPPDAGLAAVYHDVLIAYDEQRRLNNGQPSLWAFVFDKLGVVPRERVVHLGCGMGYYSAILAELVGRSGKVSAIEIDEKLAERARERRLSLGLRSPSSTPTGPTFRCAKAMSSSPAPGRPTLLPAWLRCLSPKGRLVFPMTTNAGGGMLLVKRRTADQFDARFLCPVWFYEFAGARDAEVSDRLAQAFAQDRGAGVKSLRTDQHGEEATCWLHGDGWCLSSRQVDPAP